MPQTAYSTAKFAVKGFSEALIEDLRVHAPHVRVAVVMPGHVGTDIIANTLRARGLPEPADMSEAQLEELIPRDAAVRAKPEAAYDYAELFKEPAEQPAAGTCRDGGP
jgi:NAD(P)-dependent dehydrogenase (short-subunit alcohol dehydrogenase family)